MYAIACEVEGLSAGKPVADRQYWCTCSQNLPNCDLRPADKRNAGGNGTKNGNNKTEWNANGHTVLIPCSANEIGTIF